VWRLVAERIASKEEVNREYTFMDIIKANAVLDMRSTIEEEVGEILMPKKE